MKALDCYEFGRVAVENGNFYHAINWLNEALTQLDVEGDQPTVNKVFVWSYLAYANFKQGNAYQSMLLAQEILKLGFLTLI